MFGAAELRMLSRAELTDALYRSCPDPLTTERILIEFRRRFWTRAWEEAEAGTRTHVPPGA